MPITTEDNTGQRGSAVPGWQAFLVCTQSFHQWASSTSHCIYWVILVQGQDPSGPSAYWLRKLCSCHVWPIITHMCRKGNHWPKQPCTLLTMAYGGGWTQPHIYCTSTITLKKGYPGPSVCLAKRFTIIYSTRQLVKRLSTNTTEYKPLLSLYWKRWTTVLIRLR